MEATVDNGWQRLQTCSISSCTTSLKHKFVGLCGTTHERVCGLKSGVGGKLGGVTQIDPRFGLTCKLESYKNLFDRKRERKREKER